MFSFLDRALIRIHSRFIQRGGSDGERGDIPGWVLITIMTAGMVIVIWAMAQPLLTAAFKKAMDGVTGP